MTCIFYIGLICCTVFYYMIHESRKRNCKLLTNSTLYDKMYVGMYTVLSMAQHNRYYVVIALNAYDLKQLGGNGGAGALIEGLKKKEVGLPCILACVYFLALPLTITINSAGNSFLKLLTIPIAGYFVANWFFYRKKLELNAIHLLSFLYLITVVMTLFADRSPVALQYVRGYFETMGLMFLITMRKYTENEIKAFELVQLALLGVMITLGFIGADWYGDRNTMTIFGTTSDPNYFTGFFLLPMAVAMKKIRENKIYTVVCAVMLALGAYMVFTSGSRGGLFGLAVMIMSYVFINAKGAKQRIIGICTAIGMAVILWTIVIPLLPDDVSARFSIKELIESHGTGRGDIWLSMLDTIKRSSRELLYGRGIFAYHEMMLDGRLVQVVAHNQLIQLLYNQGIPGFVTFTLMSLAAVLRNIKKRGYISAAMLGILALSMTLTINTSIKAYWNLLIYAAFSFDTPEK